MTVRCIKKLNGFTLGKQYESFIALMSNAIQDDNSMLRFLDNTKLKIYFEEVNNV